MSPSSGNDDKLLPQFSPGDNLTTDNTSTESSGKFDVLRSARWHRVKLDFTGSVEITGMLIFPFKRMAMSKIRTQTQYFLMRLIRYQIHWEHIGASLQILLTDMNLE